MKWIEETISQAPEKTGFFTDDFHVQVQVFFPGKPQPETLTFLKKNGFRWTPTAGAWQQYRSTRAWNIACDAAKMAGANN
jgi:hypothetical protein